MKLLNIWNEKKREGGKGGIKEEIEARKSGETIERSGKKAVDLDESNIFWSILSDTLRWSNPSVLTDNIGSFLQKIDNRIF